MDGNHAAAGQQLAILAQSLQAGQAAPGERPELAPPQALYALAPNDVAAARKQIATMQTHAASLPRRARYEAMRGELTVARVALASGDLTEAAKAVDRAATVERESAGSPVAG